MTETDFTQQSYVDRARELGVNVEDPAQMHALVRAFMYCSARFKVVKSAGNYKAELEERYGWSEAEIANMRQSPLIPVATQIIGEVFMQRLTEEDLRSAAMKVYFDDTLSWLKNMSRIAKGEPKEKGGVRPYEKDQISAFLALQQISMGEGFTKMLFSVGEDSTQENAYLDTQKKLKSGDVVVVDAEVKQE